MVRLVYMQHCRGLTHAPGGIIFDLRGISREQGVMVALRPDQHVANVLPLNGYDALADFFGQFLIDQY